LYSRIIDVQYFRIYNCGTDHQVVVAKGRETLTVSKLVAQNFDVRNLISGD